jgi:hypothetical protein
MLRAGMRRRVLLLLGGTACLCLWAVSVAPWARSFVRFRRLGIARALLLPPRISASRARARNAGGWSPAGKTTQGNARRLDFSQRAHTSDQAHTVQGSYVAVCTGRCKGHPQVPGVLRIGQAVSMFCASMQYSAVSFDRKVAWTGRANASASRPSTAVNKGMISCCPVPRSWVARLCTGCRQHNTANVNRLIATLDAVVNPLGECDHQPITDIDVPVPVRKWREDAGEGHSPANIIQVSIVTSVISGQPISCRCPLCQSAHSWNMSFDAAIR